MNIFKGFIKNINAWQVQLRNPAWAINYGADNSLSDQSIGTYEHEIDLVAISANNYEGTLSIKDVAGVSVNVYSTGFTDATSADLTMWEDVSTDVIGGAISGATTRQTKTISLKNTKNRYLIVYTFTGAANNFDIEGRFWYA